MLSICWAAKYRQCGAASSRFFLSAAQSGSCSFSEESRALGTTRFQDAAEAELECVLPPSQAREAA